MRTISARTILLIWLCLVCGAGVAAAQTTVYDPATGKWNEVPQAFEPTPGSSVIIWLFSPGSDNSKAIAAVEAKDKVLFMSTGIVSGQDSFADLRFFDPPDYDPQKPGKWLKITKTELVQGRAIVTLEDGKVWTIYGLMPSFSGMIAPGRAVPEPPKPAAN